MLHTAPRLRYGRPSRSPRIAGVPTIFAHGKDSELVDSACLTRRLPAVPIAPAIAIAKKVARGFLLLFTAAWLFQMLRAVGLAIKLAASAGAPPPPGSLTFPPT